MSAAEDRLFIIEKMARIVTMLEQNSERLKKIEEQQQFLVNSFKAASELGEQQQEELNKYLEETKKQLGEIANDNFYNPFGA